MWRWRRDKAQGGCLPPARNKKPVGGMAAANWTFECSDINRVDFEIEIIDNAPLPNASNTSNLFLQLYDDPAYYCGLQTTNGRAIFSIFGTYDLTRVRTGPAAQKLASETEGGFISLRRDFGSLPPGNYKVRIERTEYDPTTNRDWFGFYVSTPTPDEELIGSVAFNRSDSASPVTLRDWGGTWVEAWDNNGPLYVPVELWQLRINARANKNVRAKTIDVSYLNNPNHNADVAIDDGRVRIAVGGETQQCHGEGNYEL